MTNKSHDADVSFIQALAGLLKDNDLSEIEVKREYGEDDSLNVRVSRHVAAPAPVAPKAATERVEAMEPSDRAMLARRLRGMSRGSLGPRRDRAEMLARRIDALLERMSEASGAGRW